MKISSRLAALLAIALGTQLLIGAMAILNFMKADWRFEQVQTDVLPSINALEDVSKDALSLRVVAYQISISRDEADRQKLLLSLAEIDKEIDEKLTYYRDHLVTDDTDRTMLASEMEAMQENIL